MHIVERPSQSPGFCMASLATEDREGFIDTGLDPAMVGERNGPDLVDPRVYISVTWVKEMARKMGMVEKEKVDSLERENTRLSEELKEADRLVEAAEYTFSHFGGKIRQKPGPKKVIKDL